MNGNWKLVLVALAAFGFSFALVPLYEVACEKVFGIRLEREAVQAPGADAKVSDRVVTVIFDGGVNSKLPWAFEPNQLEMQVRPGQLYETTYFARNKSDKAVVGSAVPSPAPHHTFTRPPVIRDADLAHGDFAHMDYE